jgi:hypothetical protein
MTLNGNPIVAGTSVITDSTLTGNGTGGSPLSVSNTIARVYNIGGSYGWSDYLDQLWTGRDISNGSISLTDMNLPPPPDGIQSMDMYLLYAQSSADNTIYGTFMMSSYTEGVPSVIWTTGSIQTQQVLLRWHSASNAWIANNMSPIVLPENMMALFESQDYDPQTWQHCFTILVLAGGGTNIDPEWLYLNAPPWYSGGGGGGGGDSYWQLNSQTGELSPVSAVQLVSAGSIYADNVLACSSPSGNVFNAMKSPVGNSRVLIGDNSTTIPLTVWGDVNIGIKGNPTITNYALNLNGVPVSTVAQVDMPVSTLTLDQLTEGMDPFQKVLSYLGGLTTACPNISISLVNFQNSGSIHINGTSSGNPGIFINDGMGSDTKLLNWDPGSGGQWITQPALPYTVPIHGMVVVSVNNVSDTLPFLQAFQFNMAGSVIVDVDCRWLYDNMPSNTWTNSAGTIQPADASITNVNVPNFHSTVANTTQGPYLSSLIFNEWDGGGSQITNQQASIETYCGVNSSGGSTGGDDYVELYSKTTTNQVGSRVYVRRDGVGINMNNTKVFASTGSGINGCDISIGISAE